MARGRRSAKRDAALKRQNDQRERDAVVARAAKTVIDRWGDEPHALARLSALSRELEKLHKEETRLLRERDQLVTTLRQSGNSWAALSARAKLSRQALMKRV